MFFAFSGSSTTKRTVLMSDVAATEIALMLTPSRPRSSLMVDRLSGTLSRLTDSCLMTIRSILRVVVPQTERLLVEFYEFRLAFAEDLFEVLQHGVVGDHAACPDEGAERG